MSILAELHAARAERLSRMGMVPAPLAIEPPVVNVPNIIRAVARHYNITPEQILSRNKSEQYAEPRRVAMYLATQLTKASLTRLGQLFERHHTSVLSSRQRVESLLATDEALQRKINALTYHIKTGKDLPPIRTDDAPRHLAHWTHNELVRLRECLNQNMPRQKISKLLHRPLNGVYFQIQKLREREARHESQA